MADIDVNEVKFARSLVNPKKDVRDKTLSALLSYLSNASHIDELSMLKLWKALYYCMWLADKGEIQNELAKALTGAIFSFSFASLAHLYLKSFFKTIVREWSLIDQHRINKFYILIRLMVRSTFEYLHMNQWKEVETIMSIIESEVLQKRPNGIRFHICDILWDEVFVACNGHLNTKIFMKICAPFMNDLTKKEDITYIDRTYKMIFNRFLSTFARENKSSNEDDQLFVNVDTIELQSVIFDLAANKETPDHARAKLYELHQSIGLKTRQQFVEKQKNDQIKSIEKKNEPVLEKVIQSVEKVKSIQPVQSVILPEVPYNSSQKETNSMKSIIKENDTSSDSLKPKEKFIASSKFIGKKFPYVFRNGSSGIGYYLDIVQEEDIGKRKLGSSNHQTKKKLKK